jgi:hypothetical protein
MLPEIALDLEDPKQTTGDAEPKSLKKRTVTEILALP